MMRWRLLTMGVLLALLAGCGSTQEHRARQYSTAFGGLSTEAQERALSGGITRGDSREAVYIALGPPQSQQRIGDVEVWEYNARPIPPETPFTDGSVERYLTPSSTEWTPRWDGKSGYLALEFVDGQLDAWDYQEDGYELNLRRGQQILLPPAK